MSKHTPGPWHRNIKPASKYAIIFAGEAPRHSHVAQVLSQGLTIEEIEGNCDLIAAAPELLEALEALWCAFTVPEMQGKPQRLCAPLLERAAAVIAKARGQQ